MKTFVGVFALFIVAADVGAEDDMHGAGKLSN